MRKEAIVIDGRAFREEILSELRNEITRKNLEPKLAVIQVGDNPESASYIKRKIKAAEEIGAEVEHLHLSEKTTFPELKKLIAKLNRDKAVHGIIVQLPLPKDLDEEKVTSLVLETKDIDGLHKDSAFPPVTPSAILEILKREKISLKGKTVVLVGRGKLVGGPLYEILSQNKEIGKLISVDKSSPDPLSSNTKKADILISATGQAGLIKGEMLKEGVVVIDVGINVDPQTGKMAGDVDFDSASQVASKITPVPGGVGPMTVASLLKNLVTASQT